MLLHLTSYHYILEAFLHWFWSSFIDPCFLWYLIFVLMVWWSIFHCYFLIRFFLAIVMFSISSIIYRWYIEWKVVSYYGACLFFFFSFNVWCWCYILSSFSAILVWVQLYYSCVAVGFVQESGFPFFWPSYYASCSGFVFFFGSIWISLAFSSLYYT